MNRVIIVEDDQHLSEILKKEFISRQFTVFCATQISEIPLSENFDYAVVDMRLAHGDFGLQALEILKKHSPDIKVVILSGYGSITTAVEAVKKGAVDYLTKPASFEQIYQALMGQKISSDADFKRRSLAEVEHEYIDFLLTKNQGNISQTAKDLGLHRQSLQRKLKKYT